MSREIPLTQNKFAIVDDKDFDRLNQFKWHAVKDGKTYYAGRRFYIDKKGKFVRMHRFLLSPKQGEPIDHINRDGLDNRRENLRLCTYSQNQCNRGANKNSTSGYKGVHWHKSKGKFRAKIRCKGKSYDLGLFTCKHKAAEAYNKKAIELHGEFAFQNNIIDTLIQDKENLALSLGYIIEQKTTLTQRNKRLELERDNYKEEWHESVDKVMELTASNEKLEANYKKMCNIAGIQRGRKRDAQAECITVKAKLGEAVELLQEYRHIPNNDSYLVCAECGESINHACADTCAINNFITSLQEPKNESET